MGLESDHEKNKQRARRRNGPEVVSGYGGGKKRVKAKRGKYHSHYPYPRVPFGESDYAVRI